MTYVPDEEAEKPNLDKPELADGGALDELDETQPIQGSGSRQVDANLQIMITYLKLLRDDLKDFKTEITNLRGDISALRWRSRVLGFFGIVTLAVVGLFVIFAPIAINANHKAASSARHEVGIVAQQFCDNLGSQLVIYGLFNGAPRIDVNTEVKVGQAVDTIHRLRSDLKCKPYVYEDPSTGKKTAVP